MQTAEIVGNRLNLFTYVAHKFFTLPFLIFLAKDSYKLHSEASGIKTLGGEDELKT